MADFPDGEEVVCLTVAEALTDVNAPAKINDLSVSFSKGSTSGVATFTAPTTTFGGEALTGTLTASVRIENGEPVTKSCPTGREGEHRHHGLQG